jgi:hypothetical protein
MLNHTKKIADKQVKLPGGSDASLTGGDVLPRLCRGIATRGRSYQEQQRNRC